MFFIAGTGSDYKDKKNGRKIIANCPQCKIETNFIEQVKTEYISLFFIPIISSEDDNSPKNIFRCQQCKNCYTINNTYGNNTENTMKNEINEKLANKKREQDRKKQEKEKCKKDKEIDAELLALKKKLGKT